MTSGNLPQHFLAEPSVLPNLTCIQAAIPNFFSVSMCPIILSVLPSQAEESLQLSSYLCLGSKNTTPDCSLQQQTSQLLE